MKNRLLLILLWSLPAIACSAQITITQASYPTVLTGADSLLVTTYNAVLPVMGTGAGVMWDLSAVADSTPVFFAYRVPTTTYQFADSNYYSVFSYAYQGNVQSSVSATASSDYLIRISDTAYSISSLTLSFSDSFFIPAQNAVYSMARKKVVFPAALASAWTSDYVYDVDFELSLAIYTYHHAPGIVRHHISEKDTVTGWGSMRIRDASGAASPFLDVLQVRSTIIRKDSFFLNGWPMPGTVMTLFGLVQGMADTQYIQNYYRLGEITPLAKVDFRDSACAQPFRVTTHVQRLIPSGIESLAGRAGIMAYPNPASGTTINISAPSDGIFRYQLMGGSGQKVTEGTITVKGKGGQIPLPPGANAGVYYLHLINSNQEERTIPLEIVR